MPNESQQEKQIEKEAFVIPDSEVHCGFFIRPGDNFTNRFVYCAKVLVYCKQRKRRQVDWKAKVYLCDSNQILTLFDILQVFILIQLLWVWVNNINDL